MSEIIDALLKLQEADPFKAKDIKIVKKVDTPAKRREDMELQQEEERKKTIGLKCPACDAYLTRVQFGTGGMVSYPIVRRKGSDRLKNVFILDADDEDRDDETYWETPQCPECGEELKIKYDMKYEN